jgi:hypothetical protein
MTKRKPRVETVPDAGDVDAFLARLQHARAAELAALRAIVRHAAPQLREGIKWNAPSYRLPDGDDVLTFNLGAKDRVRLVFHRGAKARPSAGAQRVLADDRGLLQWPAPDRAVATFADLAEVRAAQKDLAQLIVAWLAAI